MKIPIRIDSHKNHTRLRDEPVSLIAFLLLAVVIGVTVSLVMKILNG